MSDIVYERPQEHLDALPVGFSKTKSGVEIDILKKIFEPEDAEMALHLQPFPEPFEAFCQRTGIEPKRAEDILERLVNKGESFRITNFSGKTRTFPYNLDFQILTFNATFQGKSSKYACKRKNFLLLSAWKKSYRGAKVELLWIALLLIPVFPGPFWFPFLRR